MLKGSVVLQVAAVMHQSDAIAMADALQRKKFSAFVLTPSGDNFYRVQVGPYRDQRNAEAARSALERAGFMAIIKR
jgi:cell division septation protein DedD